MTKKKEQNGGNAANVSTSRRKRVKVQTGQLMAVPLLDGSCALLHVALYDGDIVAAHHAHRKATPVQLLEGLDEAIDNGPIAVLTVTSNRAQDGDWTVIGHRSHAYPPAMLETRGRSYTAGVVSSFFEAYHGLRPWDEMAVPRWYDEMLLPGVPVPPTVRYKRDFEQEAAAAAAPAAASAAAPAPSGPAEPPITDGPAVIHVEIRYPGDALPSSELLHRRQALERALEEAGAGEVTGAGGGGGVMDIHLDTRDVRHAMPLVHAAVKQAGFEQDATIATLPSEADDLAD